MLSHGYPRAVTWIRHGVAAERLGVSRVPVREALKILQGEGHVEYQPHHGYSVSRLDLDDFTHLVHILWDAIDVNRSLYYTDVSNRYRVRAEHAGIVQAAAVEAHAEELVTLANRESGLVVAPSARRRWSGSPTPSPTRMCRSTRCPRRCGKPTRGTCNVGSTVC